jgi:signal transduction histidine kinase
MGPEVPMILADHTTHRGTANLLTDLTRALRAHLPGRLRRRDDADAPSVEDAVVRALCHDLRGPVTWLESVLGHLEPDGGAPPRELLELAQAQAAHVASMLRTVDATAGAPPRRACGRPLGDVVAASVTASGLPRAQLTVRLEGPSAAVEVADARVQRILINLLENAHRHGHGASVRLEVARPGGWVELALTQAGIPATAVAGHLRRPHPPADLTGLGLWSVQRQARELGGRVLCEDDDGALTLRVQVPDR